MIGWRAKDYEMKVSVYQKVKNGHDVGLFVWLLSLVRLLQPHGL